MFAMKALQEILGIFIKYHKEGEDFDIAVSNDTILLLGPKPKDLSLEDAARLKELFCRYDKRSNCWEFLV